MLDANQFIKKSNIFNKSPWLKPIMFSALDNKFSSNQIDELLNKLYNLEIATAIEATVPVEETEIQPSVTKIDRITSINKIENVGLIKLK